MIVGIYQAGRLDRLSALVLCGIEEREWKILRKLVELTDECRRIRKDGDTRIT